MTLEDVAVGLMVNRQVVLIGVDLISGLADFPNGKNLSFELGGLESRLRVAEYCLADFVRDLMKADRENKEGHLSWPTGW